MRFVIAVLILAAVPFAAELGAGFYFARDGVANTDLVEFLQRDPDGLMAVGARWLSLSLLVHALAWREATFVSAFAAVIVAGANVAVMQHGFGVDTAAIQQGFLMNCAIAVLFAIMAWATATFLRAPD